MASLYPYSSKVEWAFVREVALGRRRLVVPKRRREGTGVVVAGGGGEAHGVREAEKMVEGRSLLAWPERQKLYEKKQGNGHVLTPRFLKRQYEWLLRHLPLMVGGGTRYAVGEVPRLAGQGGIGLAEVDVPEVSNEKPGEKEGEVEAEKKQPTAAFLWHSTILDRPRKPAVQTVSGRAAARLFG
jgi:hypothetical protein